MLSEIVLVVSAKSLAEGKLAAQEAKKKAKEDEEKAGAALAAVREALRAKRAAETAERKSTKTAIMMTKKQALAASVSCSSKPQRKIP